MRDDRFPPLNLWYYLLQFSVIVVFVVFAEIFKSYHQNTFGKHCTVWQKNRKRINRQKRLTETHLIEELFSA
jgi:uncharacterized membrane protein